MKNAEFLLESIDMIDESIIDEVQFIKKNKFKNRYFPICACIIFVVVFSMSAIILWDINKTKEDSLIVDVDQCFFWSDTRERNDIQYYNNEAAYILPWENQPIYSKYYYITYNNKTYSSRVSGSKGIISVDYVEKEFGDFNAIGFDEYSEKYYETQCKVYKIKNVIEEKYVAVKFEGYSEYYVYGLNEYVPFDTLGEMISKLSLSENCQLSKFYYHDEEDTTPYLISEENGIEVWKIIEEYSNSKLISDYPDIFTNKKISFSLNSNVLGINNMTMAFNSEGYLWTNAENYKYVFHIGEEAVNKIMQYALSQKIYYTEDYFKPIAGVIKEIGDSYFIIDDSIFMKNADEGIKFTVNVNNAYLASLLNSGYINVGDEILIRHEGIDKNDNTVINSVISVEHITIKDNDYFIEE